MVKLTYGEDKPKRYFLLRIQNPQTMQWSEQLMSYGATWTISSGTRFECIPFDA